MGECTITFCSRARGSMEMVSILEHSVGVPGVHGDGEFTRTFCMRTRVSMGMVSILKHFVCVPGGPWGW